MKKLKALGDADKEIAKAFKHTKTKKITVKDIT